MFHRCFDRLLNIFLLFRTSNHKLVISSFLHLIDFRMNSILLEFDGSINLSCFCCWQLSWTTNFLDQLCDVFFIILIICNLIYQFFIVGFKFICFFNLCFWCRCFNYYGTILLNFCQFLSIFTLFHHFWYFIRFFFVITYIRIILWTFLLFNNWLNLFNSFFHLFFSYLFLFDFCTIFNLNFLFSFRFCFNFHINFFFCFSLNFFFTLLLYLSNFLNFFI